MREVWIHRSCAKCGREWDENDTRELLQCGCDSIDLDERFREARRDMFMSYIVLIITLVFCTWALSGCAGPKCVNECDLGAGYQPDLPLCDSTHVQENP